MVVFDLIEQFVQLVFKLWVKWFIGIDKFGVVLVFLYVGGVVVVYWWLVKLLVVNDVDMFVVQYLQWVDWCSYLVVDSIEVLVFELFEVGDWYLLVLLMLFGYCMGVIVVFEFVCFVECNGVLVCVLWVFFGQVLLMVVVFGLLLIVDCDVLVDMVDFGGIDFVLFEDEEFVELLVLVVKVDYWVFSGYLCLFDVCICVNIYVVGGNCDYCISWEMLISWEIYIFGCFMLLYFDGGYFYFNDYFDVVVWMVSVDV